MSESALTIIKNQMEGTGFGGELKKVLPPSVTPDKFQRVVLNAIMGNNDLANANRASLFQAALQCATDGLVPDGREAALVVYKQKVGNDWLPFVRYMPMIQGVLKKIRNSGDIATISAEIVHKNDKISFANRGGAKVFEHEPVLFGDKGPVIGAYASCVYRDGTFDVELMDMDAIDAVMRASKCIIKDKHTGEEKITGPWASFKGEMMKKTVLRRLAKRLPMSTDLDDIIRREDDLYDLPGKADTPALTTTAPGKVSSLAAITAKEQAKNAPAAPEVAADAPKQDARTASVEVSASETVASPAAADGSAGSIDVTPGAEDDEDPI